jgi:uncharacterized membrane protein
MNQQLIEDNPFQSAKNLTWWLYIAHGASVVFSLGAFSFIPLIINYLKRDDTGGTFLYSHHSWQIRSFWWYLVWMTLGGILFMTIVGIPAAFLIWGVAWLWKLYRVIRGLIDLNENKVMP